MLILIPLIPFALSKWDDERLLSSIDIKDINDKQVDTLAIIENIQRENLSPIEEANAYKTLIDTYDMNQTELANKVGKKQSTIANKLRLLKLSLHGHGAL